MGSVYKKTYTKPLPANSELFTRRGEQFARWKPAKGKTQTARVTTGQDGTLRIVVESGTFVAKYRDGSGIVCEVSTGCRDEAAARSVLNRLERRAELVKSGVISEAEDSIADQQAVPLVEHFGKFREHLRSQEVSREHLETTRRCLARLAAECSWNWLRDMTRQSVETWMTQELEKEKPASAAAINKHITCVVTFGNWCVDNKRLALNPLSRIRKANEKADPRRRRRSLTVDELVQLMLVVRWRPLAEYGREVVMIEQPHGQPPKRTSWKRAPLTFKGLRESVERAGIALADNPGLIDELDRLGRERALIVKTLALTGLRQGELASLTVGQLVLDSSMPYLVLNAADEKNGEGSEIPLRVDLAENLSTWAGDRDASQKLFTVPKKFVKVLDRDMKAAGIPKRDDRGRTVDVHALRHTFGTLLSKVGVAPRTAQAAMRHSSIDLTMNTYTDPRMLDVQKAVETLPEFSWLAPLLALDAGQTIPQLSIPDTSTTIPSMVESVEKPAYIQRKSRDSQGKRATAKSGRYRDRTCDPFRVKEEGDSSNLLAAKQVTANRDLACTVACTNTVESGVPSDGTVAGAASNLFAAALVMIAKLPLSDADKAEAVKRLLAQV